METKVTPTKLDVFNIGNHWHFDVDTPLFLKETCENSHGGIYGVCWNIFKSLLAQVAERATELNDPVLNALMIRMNLYEISHDERYNIIRQLKKMYDESQKQ